MMSESNIKTRDGIAVDLQTLLDAVNLVSGKTPSDCLPEFRRLAVFCMVGLSRGKLPPFLAEGAAQ